MGVFPIFHPSTSPTAAPWLSFSAFLAMFGVGIWRCCSPLCPTASVLASFVTAVNQVLKFEHSFLCCQPLSCLPHGENTLPAWRLGRTGGKWRVSKEGAGCSGEQDLGAFFLQHFIMKYFSIIARPSDIYTFMSFSLPFIRSRLYLLLFVCPSVPLFLSWNASFTACIL